MASFMICTIGFRSDRQRNVVAPFRDMQSFSVCAPKKGSSICGMRCRNRLIITGRMRNQGGFHLPPRVPQEAQELGRAVELLGNYTQRKMTKTSTLQELKELVGEIPRSREIAQQWKAMLQKRKKATQKNIPGSYKHRNAVLSRIKLPDQNETVGRSFALLGCLQRRYRLKQDPSERVLQELERKIGCYPLNEIEAHHYIKALAFLQKERRSHERKPPQIPLNDMDDLLAAKMLLGAFAVKGSIGRQTKRLEGLIGTVPRNKNTARSWKKIIAAAIRKKKRKERAMQKRKEIEHKRMIRLLRKQRRALEQAISAYQQDHIHVADAQGLPSRIQEGVDFGAIERTSATIQDLKESKISKLQTVLDVFVRFFRG